VVLFRSVHRPSPLSLLVSLSLLLRALLFCCKDLMWCLFFIDYPLRASTMLLILIMVLYFSVANYLQWLYMTSSACTNYLQLSIEVADLDSISNTSINCFVVKLRYPSEHLVKCRESGIVLSLCRCMSIPNSSTLKANPRSNQ
jgi:hypothetical protein